MDVSEGQHGTDDHRHGFFGREALDLGILLLAAGAAHLVVLSLGHSDAGVRVLITVGLLLLAVSAVHRWHRHKAASAPRPPRGSGAVNASGSAGPPTGTGPYANGGLTGGDGASRGAGTSEDTAPPGNAGLPGNAGSAGGGSFRSAPSTGEGAPASAGSPAGGEPVRAPSDDLLWSVRATVADVPGGLAALTARFAALGIDIRLMQVHPAGPDAVDEFFVSAPAHVGEGDLYTAVREAGGREAAVRRADVHELSDTTSRTLALVSALVTGATTLERSLLSLASARAVEHTAEPPAGTAREDLSGTVMTLPAPDGGVLTVRREVIPFTAVEFARCRALAHVASSLHARSHGPGPGGR
ncbi:ACT domain-containing protein [Nocardiopsis dassonvillei]|uniref:ACT domain-containing protein n=1 Tax=Nocardiopsis dassonvillei TaxID=2014 RepID=UPI000B9D6041|nr:ACT domain-containing protein [Nocardiopsis dassonvillei]ASU61052.1 amino acid-binding protein [Nocardiopsis dassonvillei]